jgi:hypothetical protein
MCVLVEREISSSLNFIISRTHVVLLQFSTRKKTFDSFLSTIQKHSEVKNFPQVHSRCCNILFLMHNIEREKLHLANVNWKTEKSQRPHVEEGSESVHWFFCAAHFVFFLLPQKRSAEKNSLAHDDIQKNLFSPIFYSINQWFWSNI